jgi:hypothetical protein
MGVECEVDGHSVLVGNLSLMKANSVPVSGMQSFYLQLELTS